MATLFFVKQIMEPQSSHWRRARMPIEFIFSCERLKYSTASLAQDLKSD